MEHMFSMDAGRRVEPAVLIEHCFAWVLTIARQGTGTRISPVRVELVQPRSHVKALERYFGCPVVCSSVRCAQAGSWMGLHQGRSLALFMPGSQGTGASPVSTATSTARPTAFIQ